LAYIIRLLLLIPVLYGAALFAASEWGGEVVELETYDGRGVRFETSLWIVEADDDLWLRAGHSEAAWLQRLKTAPEVLLRRQAGRQSRHRAVVVPGSTRRVNELMRQQYGWADRLISPLLDPAKVVAVRLEEP